MHVDLNTLDWREFTLFEGIREEIVRKFLSVGFHFQYEPETLIISNQDAGETFFLILHGLAKLILVNCDGQPLNVTLFRSGDFVGELSILGRDSLRNGDIAAISEVDVLAIHKKDFLRMISEEPLLGLNLAREIGLRLRTMNERLITDRLPSDHHKVAHTLLLLINKGKIFNQEGPILMPPLSLKEWAAFCYTTHDIFIDSIEHLKTTGALEWQNQRIVVTNLDTLQHCAEPHQDRLNNCLKLPKP